jgi:glycosyltransferase involved in cell wall biosynthesis
VSPNRKIAVVLKGYPRLSETFIAQELLGLERAGHDLVLVALRRPTDLKRHPVHEEIRAAVHYLPEYLHDEPWRVLRALMKSLPEAGFWRALGPFLHDLLRDRTRNRVRRFGQALVLVAEWPGDARWLHAHFIHTPASVTAYASMIAGVPWTCSAHAKDIWTSSDWELSEKLGRARWTVTCTRSGFEHLKSLTSEKSRVHLSYHGLDLDRFPVFDGDHSRRDGSDPGEPVRIMSVGRAVAKKGFDILLKALSLLHADLNWRRIFARWLENSALRIGFAGTARSIKRMFSRAIATATSSRSHAGSRPMATATGCRMFWSRRRASGSPASRRPCPAFRNCSRMARTASSCRRRILARLPPRWSG